MLKLLIYIDGSAASQRAIDYIASVAQEPDVEVSLLTAQTDAVRAADLYSRMASRLQITTIRHVARTEAADMALLAETQAGDYDLAVFGPMRERWSRWVRLRPRTSLSVQLPISSLLVRGSATHISRVLLCAGGDGTIVADARLTVRLARRAGATARLLHVLSQLPMLFGVRTPAERVTEAFAATGAPEMVNMQAALEVLRAGGVSGEIKVRVGLIIDEIVAELQDGQYDLLVIGAHRSQGLVERLLLEDVTQDILGHSPVPVLVVKTTAL